MTILSANDQQILEAVRGLLTERAMWKVEAARLHRLLQQQIAQNGELIRQGRTLDGERPEYVTAGTYADKTGTFADKTRGFSQEWEAEIEAFYKETEDMSS